MFNKLFKTCLGTIIATLVGVMFVTNSAFAELKIDIIAGASEPIPVAILKFEIDDKIPKKIAAELRDVLENNLKSTGLFRIINRNAMPEFVKLGEMPNFNLWMSIKAQVLVQTKMTLGADGRYKVEFYVWDVNGKEQIEAQALYSSKKSARRLAHIESDAIYERLTGEIGYFDTQIVFIAETGAIDKRVKRMAIMDQDGHGFRYMSDSKSYVMSPHFSPNMHTIVFLSYRDDDPMVWTLDMDTGEQRRLGRFGGMTFSPRFSPDGTKVALSLAKDGITNIHEYDISKKTLRQLTFGKSIDTSPSYSPNGKFLAFNSNRSGSQQLHVLDMTDLTEKRLTYGAGRYATPAWSPDGRFIAFTKMSDGTFYVGIMNDKGKNEKILAGGWFMESPSWAPGSRRIVYYETEKALDDFERMSHIRSVDITGQNIYDIDLPKDINGLEATWSPKNI